MFKIKILNIIDIRKFINNLCPKSSKSSYSDHEYSSKNNSCDFFSPSKTRKWKSRKTIFIEWSAWWTTNIFWTVYRRVSYHSLLISRCCHGKQKKIERSQKRTPYGTDFEKYCKTRCSALSVSLNQYFCSSMDVKYWYLQCTTQ